MLGQFSVYMGDNRWVQVTWTSEGIAFLLLQKTDLGRAFMDSITMDKKVFQQVLNKLVEANVIKLAVD